MAADLGGFTDVLLLVGLAAGLVWWYYNKPTPKVEQKKTQNSPFCLHMDAKR